MGGRQSFHKLTSPHVKSAAALDRLVYVFNYIISCRYYVDEIHKFDNVVLHCL